MAVARHFVADYKSGPHPHKSWTALVYSHTSSITILLALKMTHYLPSYKDIYFKVSNWLKLHAYNIYNT